ASTTTTTSGAGTSNTPASTETSPGDPKGSGFPGLGWELLSHPAAGVHSRGRTPAPAASPGVAGAGIQRNGPVQGDRAVLRAQRPLADPVPVVPGWRPLGSEPSARSGGHT